MLKMILITVLIVAGIVSGYAVYLWIQRSKAAKDSYKLAIVQQALENSNFRKVLATTPQAQIVVMSIEQGSQIGEEVHPTTDQFLFFVKGKATGILNGQKIEIAPNDMVIVPAGTKHNIINTGTEDLKLFTMYVPPTHKPTTIHPTKADAEKDTEDTYTPKQ